MYIYVYIWKLIFAFHLPPFLISHMSFGSSSCQFSSSPSFSGMKAKKPVSSVKLTGPSTSKVERTAMTPKPGKKGCTGKYAMAQPPSKCGERCVCATRRALRVRTPLSARGIRPLRRR